MKYWIIAFTLFIAAPALADGEKIVVTIKPLHSLVAGVMEGTGDAPMLLVDGKSSPHMFHLKPSQVEALQHAEVIFYIGDGFELFLKKVFESLPPAVRRAPMHRIQGLTLYPARLLQGFEPHAHGDDSHEEEAGMDFHLWMSPANAKVMVQDIARQLSAIYPQHQKIYAANAKKLSADLDVLDAELRKTTKPLAGKPFIVFHDAYQYFEKTYGLTAAGSVTLHPEQALSAKHVETIRNIIRDKEVSCIFREPSFDGRIVDNIVAGTKAKNGVLDPEGALLAPSTALYFQLMRGIADNLTGCLVR